MKLLIYTMVILVLIHPGNTTFKKLRKPLKQLSKHGFLGSGIGFGDALNGILRYAPAFYDTTHNAYKKFLGGHHKHKHNQYAPGFQCGDNHYDHYDTKYGSGFGHFDDYVTPYHSAEFFPTPYHSFNSFDNHIPSFKDLFQSDLHTGSIFFDYPKLFGSHDDFFEHSIHNILR